MKNAPFALLIAAVLGSIGLLRSALADHPTPSLYPIAWELKFDHSKPKRVVLNSATSSIPQVYWYMTYTVTNNSDKEQIFLPVFEMLTRDGRVFRSDKNIPASVLDAIRQRERNKNLQSSIQIGGELRVGEDQGKDGVAIWPEPDRRMGTFTVFVGGLSGEIAQVKDNNGQPMKDKDGQPIILRKTLELTYQVPGDETHPDEHVINEQSSRWIMR